MSDASHADVTAVLREFLQQQTAMLQVQAESLRLQRVLVERLLGGQGSAQAIGASAASTPLVAPEATVALAETELTEAPPTEQVSAENTIDAPPLQTTTELPTGMPPPADQSATGRGARYYQLRPSPTAKVIAPEEVELMRRLQEMRDAGDLILQFGPHKGSTLSQVAMHHPDYIRQLVTRAQRPEVRAAAGRLVEALDAAAEHKRRPTRTAARRGRAPR
jgi:hypothetical protein